MILAQRSPLDSHENTCASGPMRVCLEIDAAGDSMQTVSASEPLLFEAAYVIMARESFDPLTSFKSVVEGFAVHKGDCGEFLALLLLTMARDQAVGPPDWFGYPEYRFFDFASFMYRKLFSESPPAIGLKELHEDFPQAMMHFNHFVKLHDLNPSTRNAFCF